MNWTFNSVFLIYSSDDLLLKWHHCILSLIIISFILQVLLNLDMLCCWVTCIFVLYIYIYHIIYIYIILYIYNWWKYWIYHTHPSLVIPKKRSGNQLFNFFIRIELTNFYSLMDWASQETYDRSKLEQFGATTGTKMLLKPDQRFELT